jgi:pimeloyl-ACP methyl ester carboxylesterase
MGRLIDKTGRPQKGERRFSNHGPHGAARCVPKRAGVSLLVGTSAQPKALASRSSPGFDRAVMLASIHEARESYWDEWSKIQCPVLVVRGEQGIAHDQAAAMIAKLPHARTVVIPNTGHDVHLRSAGIVVQRYRRIPGRRDWLLRVTVS